VDTKDQLRLFNWVGWSTAKGIRFLERCKMGNIKKEKECYLDKERNLWIHVYAIHDFKCRCGEKVNRVPIKEDKNFFYGKRVYDV